MSERERLIGVVRSLTGAVEATRPDSMLNQILKMAILEAAECLVLAGFEPARLSELGVADEMAYLVDAKYRASEGMAGSGRGSSRRAPHLRLVGS